MAIRLETLCEIDLGSPIGQCRAVPVRLGSGKIDAILVAYAADFDVDPYVEMFFFPTDTIKLVLLDLEGRELWRRDLGRGVVPGIWFCPVFAFDLDGDGVDEIYFPDQMNAEHPLSLDGFRLRQLDGATGESRAELPWFDPLRGQEMGKTYRHFIFGGYANGSPVLVKAQGTYGTIRLQALNSDLSERWLTVVDEGAPGARGSHMCAVVDLNDDGIDEALWGERCLSLDDGRQLFCADEDTYRGHTDIVQPILDRKSGQWSIWTTRESGEQVWPRLVMFDARSKRLWGDVDQGHMDMGWCARLGNNGEQVVWAGRITGKTCGPDGRSHASVDEFAYDARTGDSVELGFSAYRTTPVDLNGDGLHEIVRGQPSGDGEVLDRKGHRLGSVGGAVAMASKFMDRPGEQLLSYSEDGKLRVWADASAEDTDAAQARYSHPFYQLNQRLSATGYNLVNLGGI